MKKIATLLLFSCSFTALAQTETETIKKATELIAEKKYESAFELLDQFDPANSRAEIVLLKEEIVLNYFVTSIMHQMFALKDIGKEEDILDYRGKEGNFGMQVFPVDSILQELIKKDSTNCRLYNGLAEFYYEVHLKYEGKWLKSDEELFDLMTTNYKKAITGNCAGYLAHYVLGYINLVKENYRESVPNFLASAELNPNHAPSHYNVAYAYLYIDDLQNAKKHAGNALILYQEPELKSDAARMLGQIYMELKDEQKALTNYELADKLSPGNYYNLKSILYLYVKGGNVKAGETTMAFFKLAPANPTIYNDLEEIYFSNRKGGELTAFYKARLDEYKDNGKVLGSLNFYLGRIHLESDKKAAKEYFTKAKEVFSKVYEKDHPVFAAIEDGLERCK